MSTDLLHTLSQSSRGVHSKRRQFSGTSVRISYFQIVCGMMPINASNTMWTHCVRHTLFCHAHCTHGFSYLYVKSGWGAYNKHQQYTCIVSIKYSTHALYFCNACNIHWIQNLMIYHFGIGMLWLARIECEVANNPNAYWTFLHNFSLFLVLLQCFLFIRHFPPPLVI